LPVDLANSIEVARVCEEVLEVRTISRRGITGRERKNDMNKESQRNREKAKHHTYREQERSSVSQQCDLDTNKKTR
jgi:hypothetical protein